MNWKWFWMVVILAALTGMGGMYLIRYYSPKTIFPIQGDYIEVDGQDIYSIERGQGKVVLFLHGFPYHSEAFYAIAGQPLDGYRFMTVDFPGAGLSSKKIKEKPTPEAIAVWLKLFLDKLGVDEVDLVGHDLGGGVAIVFAALFPQMVEKVILIAPDSSAGTADHLMSGIWRIPGLGEVWSWIRLDRQFIRGLLRKSWARKEPSWSQVVERYTRIFHTPYGRQGFLALHRGRVGFNYTPYEERFKAEACLVLWGEEDRVVPVGKGDILVKRLGHAEFERLPGLGHLPQEENPQAVYEQIQRFLNKPAEPVKHVEMALPPMMDDEPVLVPLPKKKIMIQTVQPKKTVVLKPTRIPTRVPEKNVEKEVPPTAVPADGALEKPISYETPPAPSDTPEMPADMSTENSSPGVVPEALDLSPAEAEPTPKLLEEEMKDNMSGDEAP